MSSVGIITKSKSLPTGCIFLSPVSSHSQSHTTRTFTHLHSRQSLFTICLFIYLFIYSLRVITSPVELGPLNTPTASLQRDKTDPPMCHRYDIKQSDGEVSVLELWEIWSTLSITIAPRYTLTLIGNT